MGNNNLDLIYEGRKVLLYLIILVPREEGKRKLGKGEKKQARY